MANYTNTIHRLYECKTPGEAIQAVAASLFSAAIVRNYLDSTIASQQADAILQNYDHRIDGVPGGTLGPSLFSHAGNLEQYFIASEGAADRIRCVLNGAPDELYP